MLFDSIAEGHISLSCTIKSLGLVKTAELLLYLKFNISKQDRDSQTEH